MKEKPKKRARPRAAARARPRPPPRAGGARQARAPRAPLPDRDQALGERRHRRRDGARHAAQRARRPPLPPLGRHPRRPLHAQRRHALHAPRPPRAGEDLRCSSRPARRSRSPCSTCSTATGPRRRRLEVELDRPRPPPGRLPRARAALRHRRRPGGRARRRRPRPRSSSRGDRREIIRPQELVEVDAEDDLRRRPRLEQAFTGAIRAVTSGDHPKACFTTGHGEDPSEPLREHLARNGYDIVQVEPLRGRGAATSLDGCKVLVVAGPDGAGARAEDVARWDGVPARRAAPRSSPWARRPTASDAGLHRPRPRRAARRLRRRARPGLRLRARPAPALGPSASGETFAAHAAPAPGDAGPREARREGRGAGDHGGELALGDGRGPGGARRRSS